MALVTARINCASIPLCEYLPYQEHYRSAFGIHSIRHTCNPGKVSVPFLYMWVCCAYVLKQNVITTCLLQRVSRLYSQLCDYVNTRQYLHRNSARQDYIYGDKGNVSCTWYIAVPFLTCWDIQRCTTKNQPYA